MKTEDEKHKLIEAINCKFPQNNIMELYYNIGRVGFASYFSVSMNW